jgi:hypothetical protein
MTEQEYVSLLTSLPYLRKNVVSSPNGQIPQSIAELDAAILREPDRRERSGLYGLIVSECSMAQLTNLSIEYHSKHIEDSPDDPIALSSFAYTLAIACKSYDEATELFGRAVEAARANDAMVRYTLTAWVRVAVLSGEYLNFNSCIQQLIDDAHIHRAEDQGLEFDFLELVDSSKVDGGLLASYAALQD